MVSMDRQDRANRREDAAAAFVLAKAFGISYTEISAAIDYSISTVTIWARGGRSPSPDALDKLWEFIYGRTASAVEFLNMTLLTPDLLPPGRAQYGRRALVRVLEKTAGGVKAQFAEDRKIGIKRQKALQEMTQAGLSPEAAQAQLDFEPVTGWGSTMEYPTE